MTPTVIPTVYEGRMSDNRDSDYAAFRLEVIRRVLSGFSSSDVADLLEIEQSRFPQIEYQEIAALRSAVA